VIGELPGEARRTSLGGWLLALGCAGALFASTGAARAEGDARADGAGAEADALFERGKEQLRAGDWPAACASFRRSFEQDASVSTSVKLARCHEHEGQAVNALAEYRRALALNETLPQTPERRRELEAVIRGAIAELSRSVPRLRLVISPRSEQLSVRLDGVLLPPNELEAEHPVDAGEHEIAATAPGFRTQRVRVRVAMKETRDVEIAMVRVARAPSAPTAAAPRSPIATPREAEASTHDSSGSPGKTLGVAIGAAGVATLGGAAYFGIKTQILLADAKNDCDFGVNECGARGVALIERARDAQTTALVLAGVGTGLAAVGVALFVTAPATTASSTPAGVRLSFGLSGVDLRGSF
jgi:hypothetical protein